MSRLIIKGMLIVISIFNFVSFSSCKSSSKVASLSEIRNFCDSMIIKYDSGPNPWFVLREKRSLEDMLSYDKRIDSIVIYDTSVIYTFKKRIASAELTPLRMDRYPNIIDISPEDSSEIAWKHIPSDIDVDFAVIISSKEKNDTIGFSRFPNKLIQYNQSSFCDSSLFYDLLSVICRNDKRWLDENKRYRINKPLEIDTLIQNIE